MTRQNADDFIPVSRDDVLNYCSENRVALANGAVSGAGSFQEWLEECGKGQGIPLLRGLDLRGMDLSQGDFSSVRIDGSTFEGAVLDNTSFEKASLKNICFNHAFVRDASFAGAKLSGSRFNHAKIIGSGPLAKAESRKNVDFTAADLEGVHFDGALVRNVLFTHAKLVDASLKDATLENVRFNGANMIGLDAEGSQPQFRESKGVRSHPVGIELVGSILLGSKHMEAFEGKMDDAINTPDQLEKSISRAVAVSMAGVPKIPQVREQVEIRRDAGAVMQARFPKVSQEAGISAAWKKLCALLPEEKGFAGRIRQERSAGRDAALER